MSFLSDLLYRVRALIFRGQEEREMAEEMAFHMEMAGRAAFGHTESHKEAVRDARGTRLLEDCVSDFLWSVRTLVHAPRFSVVAVLTLALGTGGVTAVFSAVDAVLLRPLPYAHAEQLVRLYRNHVREPADRNFVTVVHFDAYRARLASLSHIAATYTYNVTGADVDLGSGPERVRLLNVTADYFATLGTRPALGRAFEVREEVGAPVAIVSWVFWTQQLRRDPHVLGRGLTLDGRPFTIVGVAPEDFHDPLVAQVDAWTPIDIAPRADFNEANSFLTVLGRLRTGTSIAQAQAELDALGLDLARQYPRAKESRGVLVPLKADVVGTAGRDLTLMLGAVGLVMLLVCVNVANLLLVRGSERNREMAVRSALGARQGRLVRQLLMESGTLALVGGVAGVVVARVAMAALVRLGQGSIPRLETLTLHPGMLAFALGLASLSALAFGLIPAIRAARIDPGAAMQEQSRGSSAGAAHGRLRFGLVVAQVGLAFVLLVGAGLLLTSLARLRETPLGIRQDNVLTFDLALPDALYDSTGRARFYETFARRVASIPGVRAAGGISKLPATGNFHEWGTTALTGPIAGWERYQAQTQNRVVSGEYFAAAGIPLIEGRLFAARDSAGAMRHLIISASGARQFFPGVDPIGQQITTGGPPGEIVGVVGDVAIEPDGSTEAYLYHAHTQFASDRNWELTQVVRSAGAPRDLIPVVRRTLASIDPRLVLDHPSTLADDIGEGSAQRVFTVRLLASFAVVALVLAAIGLFGVLSYVVTLRRKEIGIRMALGADGGTIRRLVLVQGVTVTAIGIALGLVGALVLSRVMASLLFDTSPLDPRVLAGAVLFMVVVAAAAAYFPARRATAVDPRLVLQGD